VCKLTGTSRLALERGLNAPHPTAKLKSNATAAPLCAFGYEVASGGLWLAAKLVLARNSDWPEWIIELPRNEIVARPFQGGYDAVS